jgi:hypothetical protein
MHHDQSGNKTTEKRIEPRSATLRNHRAEVKFVGEPIYQFKVTDVSTQGAGLLINPDSRFLKIIAPDQVIEINFISPQGEKPAGMYKAQVKHITDMTEGRYKGLRRVGILILESLDQS